jgi:hypothetical protein
MEHHLYGDRMGVRSRHDLQLLRPGSKVASYKERNKKQVCYKNLRSYLTVALPRQMFKIASDHAGCLINLGAIY